MTDHHRILPHLQPNQQPNPTLPQSEPGTATNHPPPTIHVSKLPGDPASLRGIPALSRGGLGGHIHGTRPDSLDWIEKPPAHHRRKL